MPRPVALKNASSFPRVSVAAGDGFPLIALRPSAVTFSEAQALLQSVLLPTEVAAH
jgi:hypothetical protein